MIWEYDKLRKFSPVHTNGENMTQYNIHAAKTNLSQLVNQALAGKEIVIARGEKPLVKLVPLDQSPVGRVFGSLKGTGHVDDSFFDPLPEEELAAWEGK